MNKCDSIKVGLVGCGRIGAEWDSPESDDASLTHAHAFVRHPNAQLVAVCDHNILKAQAAAKRWSVERHYDAVDEMLTKENIELLVVATSSTVRKEVILPALEQGIRYFIIEKPLSSTAIEARELKALLDQYAAKVLVNYSRRWDSGIRALKDNIKSGMLGSIQRVVAFYGKGMLNNGSHIIDLMCMLFDVLPVRASACPSPITLNDALWRVGSNDSTFDAKIVFAATEGPEFQLDLISTDQAYFTCFEVRIIGEKALCDITRGGRHITISSLTSDPHFKDYIVPDYPVSLPTFPMNTLDNLAQDAITIASGMPTDVSNSLTHAVTVCETVSALQESLSSNGRWIELPQHHIKRGQ